VKGEVGEGLREKGEVTGTKLVRRAQGEQATDGGVSDRRETKTKSRRRVDDGGVGGLELD
jgi:hypothetical protein